MANDLVTLTKEQIEDINEDLAQIYHMGTIENDEGEPPVEPTYQQLEHIVFNCTELAKKVRKIIDDSLPRCECCGKLQVECDQEKRDIANHNDTSYIESSVRPGDLYDEEH